MSPQIQTIAALAVVAVAATWLILRALAKRRSHSACSDGCGCEATELKAKLKR